MEIMKTKKIKQLGILSASANIGLGVLITISSIINTISLNNLKGFLSDMGVPDYQTIISNTLLVIVIAIALGISGIFIGLSGLKNKTSKNIAYINLTLTVVLVLLFFITIHTYINNLEYIYKIAQGF